jgi:nucleoside-diphosphate-sugar epimerase
MGGIIINNNIITDRRILITGASGFIGTHLINRLKGSDNSVAAVYYGDVPYNFDDEIYSIEADITDENAVDTLVKDFKPEIVFHLAALLGAERSYEFASKVLSTNLLGTNNILKSLGTNCPELQRIVLIGTSEEYGNNEVLPFTEEHPSQPVSPYSASKAAATQFALLYHKLFQLPVVILRPFIIFGPNQSTNMFIPDLIKCGIEGKDFAMTYGEQTRDFLYVDDLIDALLSAAVLPSAVGEIINICSGIERPISEVAQVVHHHLKTDMKLLLGARPYRENEVWRLYGSNKKAKKLLGWEPKISFEEGLIRTISWYRKYYEGK